MQTSSIIIKAAVLAAVPLLACSTYYTLERLGSAGTVVDLAASLALPVMLLGIAGTVDAAASSPRKQRQFRVSVLAVALPALLLAFVWL